jgi:hypothetical protein
LSLLSSFAVGGLSCFFPIVLMKQLSAKR